MFSLVTSTIAIRHSEDREMAFYPVTDDHLTDDLYFTVAQCSASSLSFIVRTLFHSSLNRPS